MDPLTPNLGPIEGPTKRGSFGKKTFFVFIFLALALFLVYFLFISAPANFPQGQIISIAEGSNLRSLSRSLEDQHIISSRVVFETFVIIYGGERHFIPGDYFFEKKLPVFEIARRISRGESHLAPVKVTIPEGFNVGDIATTFDSKLAHFDKASFLLDATSKEGYLFPDTYFFLTTATALDVERAMTQNYEKKVAPLRKDIMATGSSEKQIVVMASLIEREASGASDRGIISGILWHRIKIGMPLQVDAAPVTYKVKGLPSSPIANPGMSAILAAIHPVASPYLYYLHDASGNVHYAKTFAEHKANKLKYLK